MDILGLAVLFVLFLVAGSICGMVALQRVKNLQRMVARLEAQLAGRQEQPLPVEPPPEAAPRMAKTGTVPAQPRVVAMAEPTPAAPFAAKSAMPSDADKDASEASTPGELEKDVAGRWMVWIGGIALALAGIFLIKFGVEHDLLGPLGRVLLAQVLGLCLVVASEWVRWRNTKLVLMQADYVPPALAGGGVITLYASLLAAFELYQLLSPGVTFALLALVSALAMGLSLRQGPFLAALGLLGAYLVPLLVSTSHSSLPGLLLYVGAVTLAALGLQHWVSRRWLWWGTVAGHFGWLLLAQSQYRIGDEAFALGFLLLSLYLFLALPALGWRLVSRHVRLPFDVKPCHRQTRDLSLVALLVCLLLLFLLDYYRHLPVSFAALGLLVLFLGWLPRRAAGLDLLPWLALATALAAFLLWPEPHWRGVLQMMKQPLAPAQLARQWQWSLLMGLGLLALALWRLDGRHWHFWLPQWRPARLLRPGLWASLMVTAPLLLLAFSYLRAPVGNEGVWADASLQWPLQALLLFLLFSALVAWRGHWPQGARVATLAGANAALTLACWMFFAETSLTVALAVQLALLARLARDQGDLVPRWLIKVLAMAVILRLSANPWLLSYPLQGLFGLHWSLYGYGIPVLACALAARWLPERPGDNTPRWLEAGCLHLLTLWLTLEQRYWLSDGDPWHGPLELADTALYAATWGALGLIYGWKARLGGTLAPVYRIASPLLLVLMMALSLLGSSLWFNPLHSAVEVGEWPILNLTLLGWGVPTLLAALALVLGGLPRALRSLLGGYALLMGWAWLSLEVRQLWHGTLLNGHQVFSAEQYAYSAVWLGAAVLLMLLGGWLKLARVRQAALLSVALAVLKIFLWDMSELEGLYRVASFLGLGLCMVGLGWFYQRQVLPTMRNEPRE